MFCFKTNISIPHRFLLIKSMVMFAASIGK
jgi:hypothetical protein